MRIIDATIQRTAMPEVGCAGRRIDLLFRKCRIEFTEFIKDSRAVEAVNRRRNCRRRLHGVVIDLDRAGQRRNDRRFRHSMLRGRSFMLGLVRYRLVRRVSRVRLTCHRATLNC